MSFVSRTKRQRSATALRNIDETKKRIKTWVKHHQQHQYQALDLPAC